MTLNNPKPKPSGFGKPPKNPADVFYNLGFKLANQGLLAEATEAFRNCIKSAPNFAEAYYNLGVMLIRQNRLEEVEAIFRQCIQLKPDYAEAHYNLGVILSKKNLIAQAKEAYLLAITHNSDYAEAYLNLAQILSQEGAISEATIALRNVIHLQPNNTKAYYSLALLLMRQGLSAEARVTLRNLIQIQPDYAEAHYKLSLLLIEQKAFTEAEKACRQAIQLKPDYLDAINTLTWILIETNQLKEAENICQSTIKINPYCVEAHYNLARTKIKNNSLKEAEQIFRECIKIDPKFAKAYHNLGFVLLELEELEAATQVCRQGIELDPECLEAHYNLGYCLSNQGLLKEAEEVLRTIIKIKPDFAEAHFNLASTLLLGGNFAEGWQEYEWRWQLKNINLPMITKPIWDGSSLQNKTILLVAEEGLGDNLQFIRYAPLIKEMGAKVKLLCQQSLVKLFASLDYLTEIKSWDEPLDNQFDCWVPLGSLMRIFATTLTTIPQQIPYLKSCKSFTLEAPPGTKIKIGIVWASGQKNNDPREYNVYRRKSTSVDLFVKLLSVPEIALYSLQVGPDALQIEPYPRIINLTSQIKDFTDTGAIIDQLDLVISVDTSVAHLAGAMGKPVWLLLPYMSEWRWLTKRTDSPWYPTMRLFRQPKPGDWESVFVEVIKALKP